MKRNYDVVFHGTNLECIAALKTVAHEFSFILQRHLDIYNAHRNVSDVEINKTKLYIRFFSWPYKDRNAVKFDLVPTKEMFGIPLDEGQITPGWVQSKSGKHLLYNKIVVATIINSTVFIPFDLPHSKNNEHVEMIFRKIMELVALEFIPQKTIDEQRQKYIKFANEKSPQLYAEICNERIVKNLRDKKNQLKQLRQVMSSTQQQYIAAMRDIAQTEREIETYSFLQTDEERRITEFKKIQELPHITKTSVMGRNLIVETDELRTQKLKDGTIRDLGRYKILVCLDEANVKINNITRLIDNKHHPHVSEAGDPCFGNIQESIANLVAKYEMGAIVDITIKYLQAINEGDRLGVTVYKWPIYNPTPVIAEKPKPKAKKIVKNVQS